LLSILQIATENKPDTNFYYDKSSHILVAMSLECINDMINLVIS